jgi:hypothetical protein
MRYLIVFNLFCLAIFLQLAGDAPLVDENERLVDEPRRSRRDLLRGLIAPADAK